MQMNSGSKKDYYKILFFYIALSDHYLNQDIFNHFITIDFFCADILFHLVVSIFYFLTDLAGNISQPTNNFSKSKHLVFWGKRKVYGELVMVLDYRTPRIFNFY